MKNAIITISVCVATLVILVIFLAILLLNCARGCP